VSGALVVNRLHIPAIRGTPIGTSHRTACCGGKSGGFYRIRGAP